jgi:hypothetical protein
MPASRRSEIIMAFNPNEALAIPVSTCVITRGACVYYIHVPRDLVPRKGDWDTHQICFTAYE